MKNSYIKILAPTLLALAAPLATAWAADGPELTLRPAFRCYEEDGTHKQLCEVRLADICNRRSACSVQFNSYYITVSSPLDSVVTGAGSSDELPKNPQIHANVPIRQIFYLPEARSDGRSSMRLGPPSGGTFSSCYCPADPDQAGRREGGPPLCVKSIESPTYYPPTEHVKSELSSFNSKDVEFTFDSNKNRGQECAFVVTKLIIEAPKDLRTTEDRKKELQEVLIQGSHRFARDLETVRSVLDSPKEFTPFFPSPDPRMMLLKQNFSQAVDNAIRSVGLDPVKRGFGGKLVGSMFRQPLQQNPVTLPHVVRAAERVYIEGNWLYAYLEQFREDDKSDGSRQGANLVIEKFRKFLKGELGRAFGLGGGPADPTGGIARARMYQPVMENIMLAISHLRTLDLELPLPVLTQLMRMESTAQVISSISGVSGDAAARSKMQELIGFWKSDEFTQAVDILRAYVEKNRDAIAAARVAPAKGSAAPTEIGFRQVSLAANADSAAYTLECLKRAEDSIQEWTGERLR
jgi:hypothetical protein